MDHKDEKSGKTRYNIGDLVKDAVITAAAITAPVYAAHKIFPDVATQEAEARKPAATKANREHPETMQPWTKAIQKISSDQADKNSISRR